MSKKDLIIEHYSSSDDVLFADGFDDAIIGFDPNLWKVVYSRERCIEILITRDGMDEEEAVEFAEYNTFGSYAGEKTPVWVEEFLWNN
jgi:hypothetical protein